MSFTNFGFSTKYHMKELYFLNKQQNRDIYLDPGA